jgi:vesicle transport through interaction with t-SNAREs protein 1
MRVQ